ncbi:MAG TPA: MarR family transcriptional regulator [Thermoanaerobaculia bacterium]|nr:MarR family transcriptional regulator [Thermoanaerobaculia bacterium]
MTKLADEIKQSRGFQSKASEATIALLRTAHLVRRKAETIAEREGLTLQQYNVLRILRGARGPLPTMEISARLIEPAPGVTRFVNSLEKRGLIRREQWPGDRRHVLCQITAAGLKLLERLDQPMDEFDSASTRALTDEQVDTLLGLLASIRE